MTLRSCFEGLAVDLRCHLVEGTETRDLYEYHRGRIAELFASQPDLPLHQDTVAGFLHGFVLTGEYFVPEGSVEQQSMSPVLGGALLLGQELPIEPDAAHSAAGSGFFERTAHAAVLVEPDETGLFRALVRSAFEMTPDVPICYATLGGFCLGVLYTVPYLTTDAGPAGLLGAACELARELTP